MPRGTDTRQRLLEAAIAVIESEGEAGLTVNEIAAAVDVTKPSIYHFFGDREGLVVAALAEIYRRSLAFPNESFLELARRAQTREEYETAFFAVLDLIASDEGARRRAQRVEVLGAAVSRPRLREALVVMHRQVAEELLPLVRLGQERGFVRMPFDPATAVLWAAALFAGRHYAEIDRDADLAEWDAMTREMVRHVLFDEISRP